MPEMFTPEFQPWPKLPRLNRDIIITEKIDGTNSAVIFDEQGNWAAQSRKRLILPDKGADNYGFAQWVEANVETLWADLGAGIHFGEWWGQGILRNYGRDDRVFSLFNTSRWQHAGPQGSDKTDRFITEGLSVVPVLYRGPFRTAEITLCGLMLTMNGSVAQPGFDNPEGLVVFHTAANQMFKVTLENDDNPRACSPEQATRSDRSAMIVIEESVAGNPVTINVLEEIEDIEAVERFVATHGGELLGLDTETTGLDIYVKDYRIRLFQFGTSRESFVIPMDEHKFDGTARMVLDKCERFVLHNAAFDLQVLEATLDYPMDKLWPKVTDTQNLAHLWESRAKKEGGVDKNLEALVAYHISPEDAERIKGSIHPLLTSKYGATKATIWKKVDQFDPDYLRYSGMDPVWAVLLHEKLDPLVPAVSRPLIAFEREVARVCATMEKNGFLLDVEYTEQLRDELKRDESLAKEKALNFGVEKINAGQEVAEVLMQYGITIPGRTESGLYKVDDAFLREVAAAGGDAGELAEAVIEGKRKSKQRSSWVDAFLRTKDPSNRVHPHIQPLQARTARMSITNPATQTLPSGDWKVRRCFLADEGHRIASVDYSSQELRVLAALSGDRTMITALLRGDDLHLLTARAAFGDHLTKDSPERKYGKATNFSKVYGGGAKSIAEKQGISFPQAKKIVDAFDNTYKEVPVYSAKLQAEATKTGHVVTPTGRRLAVDADRAYSALNYVIQSTSRDVTASALLRLDDAGFTPYLRLPIHDEVLVSVPADQAEWGAAEIGRIMAHQMGPMPITTDPEVGGRSWVVFMAPISEGYTRERVIEHFDTLGRDLDQLHKEINDMSEGLEARKRAWSVIREQFEDVKFALYGNRQHAPYADQP